MSDRKTIVAWCLYDWANSAFTTLVVTFIYATYFTKTFAPDEVTGTALWSRAVGLCGVLIALASPVLGALADRGGRRRLYLVIATLVSALATTMLAFVRPGEPRAVLLALGLFVIANVAFEVGMVFYNAFLPRLVPAQQIGRVSGYGWGLGYFGGLACMGLALLAFVGVGGTPGWLSLSLQDGWNVRATNLLVAAWFLLFSLPFFLLAPPERSAPSRPGGALAELWHTFREVRRFRDMARFLLARLVYNDGLVTIFAFGGIYAGITFGFSFGEVLVFGIVINLAAGLGALAFGFLDDRAGGKATILISLVALAASVALAMAATSRAWFWVAGLGIGIFSGPNQSASRSLMARFVPPRRQSEFFGFFAFSGKFTAVAGPLLFGLATEQFRTQRAGVATVLFFFLLGAALLRGVDERRGVNAAREEI